MQKKKKKKSLGTFWLIDRYMNILKKTDIETLNSNAGYKKKK